MKFIRPSWFKRTMALVGDHRYCPFGLIQKNEKIKTLKY